MLMRGMLASQLSVVIPTFNHAAVVGEAIESALTQTLPPKEVIVVDDGSTDRTAELVQSKFGDHVRYLYQPNAGMGEARNRGHAESKTPIVAWLDADDIAQPDRFSWQYDLMMRRPDVGVVLSDFSAFDERGAMPPAFSQMYYDMEPARLSAAFPAVERVPGSYDGREVSAEVRWGNVYPQLAYGNFVHPPTVMLRREVWERAGPLDSQYLGATDWEFLVRASRFTTFARVELPLLRYRRSDDQMTAEKNIRQNVPQEVRAFERMLVTDPALLNESLRVRTLYRDWHLSLASAWLADDRWHALGELARSLRYGVKPFSVGRTAGRALLPRSLIPPLRAGWRFVARALGRT